MPSKKPFVRRFGQVDFDSMSALPGAVADDTDIFVTRRGAFGANRTLTRAQIVFGAGGVPDPLLLNDGTALAPTYSFSSDPDTGIFLDSAGISVAINGVRQFTWESTQFRGSVANSGSIINEGATNSNPTLLPNRIDVDTGIGTADLDKLSLIAGGVEGLQVSEVGGLITIPTFGPIRAPDGTAVAPSYSFTNDPDTGFYKEIDSELNVSVDGVEVATFSRGGGVPHFNVPDGTAALAGLGFISEPSTGFSKAPGPLINAALSGTVTWQFSAADFRCTIAGARPALINQLATATVPNVVPSKDDVNTGMGASQADNLTLIAGGLAALSLKEFNNGILQIPAADIAVTALAGGGQGGAGVLIHSYNVISVAASTGDSVTLPIAFFPNALIFIKNDGANSVDVFPPSGDDLGQGTNVAEALAAGASIAYIATVAQATWTPFIIAGGGGVPDPVLLGDGTASNPTYSFADDPNTGIFSNLDDSLALVAGGLKCMSVSESGGARQIGFYDGSPIPLQTGVAVTTAAIHAALVGLRLITA